MIKEMLLLSVKIIIVTLVNGSSSANFTPLSARSGIMIAINSNIGLTSSSQLFVRPILSTGAWIYLTVPALSVSYSTQMTYMVYVYQMDATNFKISVSTGSTPSIFYRLDVGYFQYMHNQYYFNTTYCMLDIKYFNNLVGINYTSSIPRTLRLSTNSSTFMSKTHSLRCMPHITGVSISGPSDISIEAGTINQIVYLDITIGPLTLVNRIIVYVLIIDQYLALFKATYRYQSGTIHSILGIPQSNTHYPNNANISEVTFIYGMGSFNYQINTLITFNFATSSSTSPSILSLSNNYIYFSIQQCSNLQQLHFNLPQSTCSQFYDAIFTQCTNLDTPVNISGLKHTLTNNGTMQQPIKIIKSSINKKIVVSVTNHSVNIYKIQPNNQYKYLQQINQNFIIQQVDLTDSGETLLITGGNHLTVYKVGNQQTFYSYFRHAIQNTNIILNGVISGDGNKIVCIFRNSAEYIITFIHIQLVGSYHITQNYNTGRISTSDIKIILKENSTKLWIFNSYGYLEMWDSNHTGIYHNNIKNVTRLKSIDDSQLIYADITDDLQIMVASTGSVNHAVFRGLNIFNLNNITGDYELFQIITQKFYQSLPQGYKKMQITNSGLIIIVQIHDNSQNYYLIYKRNTRNNYFVIADIIHQNLTSNFNNSGFYLSADGQLLIIPYNNSNILALYCALIYQQLPSTLPQQDDLLPKQDDLLPKHDDLLPNIIIQIIIYSTIGGLAGLCLLCCCGIVSYIKKQEKNKNKNKKMIHHNIAINSTFKLLQTQQIQINSIINVVPQITDKQQHVVQFLNDQVDNEDQKKLNNNIKLNEKNKTLQVQIYAQQQLGIKNQQMACIFQQNASN